MVIKKGKLRLKLKMQLKHYYKVQHTTSCIKHWGLGGFVKYSAPHQLLQRQTSLSPAAPTFHIRNR